MTFTVISIIHFAFTEASSYQADNNPVQRRSPFFALSSMHLDPKIDPRIADERTPCFKKGGSWRMPTCHLFEELLFDLTEPSVKGPSRDAGLQVGSDMSPKVAILVSWLKHKLHNNHDIHDLHLLRVFH